MGDMPAAPTKHAFEFAACSFDRHRHGQRRPGGSNPIGACCCRLRMLRGVGRGSNPLHSDSHHRWRKESDVRPERRPLRLGVHTVAAQVPTVRTTPLAKASVKQRIDLRGGFREQMWALTICLAPTYTPSSDKPIP